MASQHVGGGFQVYGVAVLCALQLFVGAKRNFLLATSDIQPLEVCCITISLSRFLPWCRNSTPMARQDMVMVVFQISLVHLSVVVPWWWQLRTRGAEGLCDTSLAYEGAPHHHLAQFCSQLGGSSFAVKPVNRFRVEGLLPSLPKLLDSSDDHTFIETVYGGDTCPFQWCPCFSSSSPTDSAIFWGTRIHFACL